MQEVWLWWIVIEQDPTDQAISIYLSAHLIEDLNLGVFSQELPILVDVNI